MMLQYTFLLALIFLTIVGIYIYFFSKSIAHKFFYPALLIFVLFSLVPISYSVYVSFTNLKTGHLLEREDVVKMFDEEVYIDQKVPVLKYQLFEQQSDLALSRLVIVVDNLMGEFKSSDSQVTLSSMIKMPENLRELAPSEVLNFIESKTLMTNSFKIIHPLGAYSFFRIDSLVKEQPRYKRLTDSKDQLTLMDELTRETLVEDTKNGQMMNGQNAIGPGYYTWVGLSQYKDLLLNPDNKIIFVKTLLWTFTWAFFSVGLTFFLGAFLAVTLNELKNSSRFIYRMIFIIPYSIPFFISVLIFKGMLNKDFGEINHWLSVFIKSPIPWLEDKWWAKISVLLVNLWLGFPYMLLVITGILQSIPKSLYEASSLEGASRLQNFRWITLPLVLRSMIPLLIGSFAFNFNNFVGIYLLTGGGPVISEAKTPVGETDILISYTYRLAFEGSQGQNFALASAVSMIIFFIVVALTLLNFKISKKLKSNE